MINNREFYANLFVLNHCAFDVILGMNWLSASHAVIDFNKRAIIFQIPNQIEFELFCGSGDLKPAVVMVRLIGRATLPWM